MKAQGATEYLVMLGVILFLGLIVGVVLFYPVGTTKDVKQSQSDIKYKIQAMNPASLKNGLVAYWKFDEGSGSAVQDSAGTNNGTTSGPAWVAGISGSGLSFDGSDDYASVSDNPDLRLNNSFSISFWIKEISFVGIYPGLFSKGSATAGGGGFLIFYSSSKTVYFKRDDIHLSSAGGQVSSAWRHFVFTYSRGTSDADSTWKWFVDGTLVASGNRLIPIYADSSILRMGQAGYIPNVVLDEVLIYNRALTADEIGVLYTVPNILKTDSIFNSNN